MYLRTKGKPVKLPLKLCKEALRWYGLHLLGKRLYDRVELEVSFTKEGLGTDVYAYCDWNDTNHKSRDFTITIRPDLSKKQMLLALAHEMIHVKQYAKGELRDYVRTNKCKFRGKLYDDKTGYWELPWEIEAHGCERSLYNRFNEYVRSL